MARTRTTLGPNWPGKRCGAYARRTGNPCLNPAMKNGRCRMHGGKATGANTEHGRLALAAATWRDGKQSKIAKAAQKRQAQKRKEAWEASKKLGQVKALGCPDWTVEQPDASPCKASSTEGESC